MAAQSAVRDARTGPHEAHCQTHAPTTEDEKLKNIYYVRNDCHRDFSMEGQYHITCIQVSITSTTKLIVKGMLPQLTLKHIHVCCVRKGYYNDFLAWMVSVRLTLHIFIKLKRYAPSAEDEKYMVCKE